MATILAGTNDRQVLAATRAGVHQAQEVVDLLGTQANQKLGLTTPHREDLVVVPEELTTSTTAEQLGISRPTLMKNGRAGRDPFPQGGSRGPSAANARPATQGIRGIAGPLGVQRQGSGSL